MLMQRELHWTRRTSDTKGIRWHWFKFAVEFRRVQCPNKIQSYLDILDVRLESGILGGIFIAGNGFTVLFLRLT